MKLEQIQSQQLNQYQLQGVMMLQMSTIELNTYLQNLALENPVIELTESVPEPESEKPPRQEDWAEADWQYTAYTARAEEPMDALALAKTDGGLDETLYDFLMHQLPRDGCDAQTEQAVRYLAACLDADGYLRMPLGELAEDTVFSEEILYRAREVLQSLEPAGVGASNLSECLVLQLRRMGGQETAEIVAQKYLEQLSRGNIRSITWGLGISEQEAVQAWRTILSLEPRPGAVFQSGDPTIYIQPDFYIEQQDGELMAHPAWEERPPFHICTYYRNLLKRTDDPEVKTYLTEKIHQAESVLHSYVQRGSTLKRCMDCLLMRQRDFFLYGPDHLHPLLMSEVAEELGVHNSTVSRAVRLKYLQCAYGTYPLSFFFSRDASADHETRISGVSARILLRKLIDEENKHAPLSDQKLAENLAQQGCTISRRTVAKYREELGIPGASVRRQKCGTPLA